MPNNSSMQYRRKAYSVNIGTCYTFEWYLRIVLHKTKWLEIFAVFAFWCSGKILSWEKQNILMDKTGTEYF